MTFGMLPAVRSLALLASLLLLPVTAQAQAEKDGAKSLQTLRVAYLTSLSFSPLFRAIDQGYLADEGIDLKLEIVASSSETVAFLGRGQLDAAFGNIGDSLFNAISRGVDVTIVGSASYYPADKETLSPAPLLISKKLKDSGAIKSVKDLKGRKFAFNTRGGVIEYLTAAALREYGMSVADLDVVTLSFPDSLPAFANGAIDASILPEPVATASRQNGLTDILVPNPSPSAMATVILFGQNLMSAKNAKLAEAFLKGLRRAAADLQTPAAIMSDENLAIWAKYTKLPPKVIAATAPYVFDKDLAVDVASLMSQQQYLVDTKQIPGSIPADRLIAEKYTARK
jgi:NitT/TauT family transport system substrate-binding protein